MRMLAVMGIGLLCAGCATAIRGTTSMVAINSEPPGADARTSLGHHCVTPCAVGVPRRLEFQITVSKAGYLPQTVNIGTKVTLDGVVAGAGNVLAGGIIGLGVDAGTGANLDHEPNPVMVWLDPAGRR